MREETPKTILVGYTVVLREEDRPEVLPHLRDHGPKNCSNRIEAVVIVDGAEYAVCQAMLDAFGISHEQVVQDRLAAFEDYMDDKLEPMDEEER
jgi:hypothetical protein